MNEDRAMEKEKILQVMEKYRDYFKEWNADVAFGVNKSNIFMCWHQEMNLKPSCFFRRRISLKRSYWARLRKMWRSSWKPAWKKYP